MSGYCCVLPVAAVLTLPCRFLSLPGCVLPGNGEVQGILPHLDEAQLDYLCQMLPVDYQTSFGGKALQCLA